MTLCRSSALALALLSPVAALAGGPTTPTMDAPVAVAPQPAPSSGLTFTVGAGVAIAPDYFGSSSYSAGPDFGFALSRLKFRDFGYGTDDPNYRKTGFGLLGSFRYISNRSSTDNPELAGLNNIRTSIELGMGLGYTNSYFQAFGNLRYGVLGHHSFVGDLGIDAIARPADKLTLTLGPRIKIGSARFNETYFGVSQAESVASGGTFAAYKPSAGIYSAGLQFGATYKINDDWGVRGTASYSRLVSDAGDSPIVKQGDKNQFGLSLGVTRRVTFGF